MLMSMTIQVPKVEDYGSAKHPGWYVAWCWRIHLGISKDRPALDKRRKQVIPLAANTMINVVVVANLSYS